MFTRHEDQRQAACGITAQALPRDDLDFAVDAVDDIEAALVDLALVLGDGAVFAFGEHDAGKGADRFLDDVAARGQYRPGGVGERLAAPVADELERDDGSAVVDGDVGELLAWTRMSERTTELASP